MSTPPPSQARTSGTRPETDERPADGGASGWLRALGPRGRRASAGAFGGRGAGTGQGLTYHTGRATGAVFPTLVGFLADSWGVDGALVFGAIGYGLAVLGLPGRSCGQLPGPEVKPWASLGRTRTPTPA